MKKIVYVVNWFGRPEERSIDEKSMGQALDHFVELNRNFLQKVKQLGRPMPPWLYQAGIRYALDPLDPCTGEVIELWQTIPAMLETKEGDCEDLAAYRTAELIERCGEKARIMFRGRLQENGRLLYHILVRRADGRIEDPSRVLGM